MKVNSKGGIEGGRSMRRIKNDEHRKREVCPLMCLIKIMIGLTITAGTHCRRKERVTAGDERTAKGEDDKRGGDRRVTERK